MDAEKARAYYQYLNDYKLRKCPESEIAAELAGLNYYNGVPSINSAVESEKYMTIMERLQVRFVGYLSYGADGIEQDGNEGFFRLYDGPTLGTGARAYNCGDLYDKYGIEPYGALQGFCGTNSVLNTSNGVNYGGQKLDTKKGTLIYNGIERYAIALGPKLQNPDFSLDEDNAIVPTEMLYGTCVDISIELEGDTYYIPAIIVDVKAHTANGGEGIFQSGYDHKGNYENTGKIGTIVEWYVEQFENEDTQEDNKTTGLGQFNRNASIIIYQEEVLR